MDWQTWAPFQSADIRAISIHMTLAEKSAAAWQGALYGIWVAISVAIPVGVTVAHLSWATVFLAVLLAAVHILCIPIWQRKQKEFLCSTDWARSQGLTPERLRRFGGKRQPQ